MKKKKLKIQELSKKLESSIIASNILRKEKESNEWKIKLYQDLAEPDLQLLSYIFEAEPCIDVTCHDDKFPQYLQTGNFTITLHLHKPIKKENK